MLDMGPIYGKTEISFVYTKAMKKDIVKRFNRKVIGHENPDKLAAEWKIFRRKS